MIPAYCVFHLSVIKKHKRLPLKQLQSDKPFTRHLAGFFFQINRDKLASPPARHPVTHQTGGPSGNRNSMCSDDEDRVFLVWRHISFSRITKGA